MSTRRFWIPRRRFRDFFSGRSGQTLAVALLPEDVALLLSSMAREVMMTREYAAKMLVKHRLTYEHLPLVQQALEEGYCFRGEKPYHFEFVYFTRPTDGGDFKLVLKTAKWGQEVWFVTMHRTNKQQYRRMRRRQTLIRDHK